MKINNLTVSTAAAVFAQVSAADTGACPASISEVTVHDPVGILVDCANVAAPTSVTSDSYAALYATCLAPLASAAGDAFPANSGTSKVCRDCYVDFAKTMVEEGLGALGSDEVSIDAPSSSLSLVCDVVTLDTAKEDCYKDGRVIAALNSFQTCAGYSLNYISEATIAHRRMLNTNDVYTELIRHAFNDKVELGAVVSAVLDRGVGEATDDLLAEVCYVMFHNYLQEYAATGVAAIINDCGSTIPTAEGCLDTTPVVTARERFAKCAGFEIDTWYNACTADDMATLAGSYDAYATLLTATIENREEEDAEVYDEIIADILDNISTHAGVDCMGCYSDLADNLKAQLDAAATEYTNDALLESFLSSCDDPSSDSCLVVIGRETLAKFKKCSGFDLNRAKFEPTTTTTTTTTASTTESTTESTTTTTTGSETTTKSSSGLVAPLASMVLLAVGSALVL